MENINKNRLYWIFQGFGWGLFFVVYSFIAVSFTEFHWKVFASYGTTVIVGFVLSHFYRSFVRRKRWIKYRFAPIAYRVILASMILAFVWVFLLFPINSTFFKLETHENEEISRFAIFLVIWFQFTVVMTGWSLIYFVFQFLTNFRKSEVEKWKLEAAVKDAELIALKSQINPHFIFNSLNNIRSLVVENPEKAREMITHLSGLLRYSVQFSNKEKVSLEDEIEIVKNYLKLESIQYEQRLHYKLEISPETYEMQIPPMAVQLLVENAIKHGISQLPKGGELHIKSQLENNALEVEVTNTGQLKEEVQGTGIGLRNASDRLKLLFGKLSDLRIQNINTRQVSAKFTIPIT